MELVTLPLFPLGLVAFPGEEVNLHIFENRYRQLIRECKEENKTFGIPPFKEGNPLVIGTEMKLLEISKVYDDGKMDVKTQAIGVFRVKEFYSKLSGKLYPGGDVERVHRRSLTGSHPELAEEVLDLIGQLYNLSSIEKDLPEMSEGFTIYQLAHKIGLSFSQELQLLQMDEEEERLFIVKRHLQAFIPNVKKIQEMKSKIKMNGHFKNIQPPQV